MRLKKLLCLLVLKVRRKPHLISFRHISLVLKQLNNHLHLNHHQLTGFPHFNTCASYKDKQ